MFWQFIAVVLFFAAGSPAAAQPSLFSDPAEAAKTLDSTITANPSRSTDKQMEERLSRIYKNIASLQAVEVKVKDGVVVLSGTLAGGAAVERARNLAERLEGAVIVDNRLRVDHGVENRLQMTMKSLKHRFAAFLSLAPLLVVAVIIIAAFYLLGRWVGGRTNVFRRMTPNYFIAELMGQFVQLGITVAGLILALQIVGAGGAVASVAGGLGIVGLALGFATRDTIENYIASILLSLKQPFSPNDHVIVADHEGLVVRLTGRATILMSFEGNHIRIPNASVYKSIIVNFTRNPQRRFEFVVGISTDADLATARKIAVKALETMPGVLDDPPPQCITGDFGDSSMLLNIRGWVDQRHADFVKVRSETIRAVKGHFDDAGIVMPNPIYNIQYATGERPAPYVDADRAVKIPDGIKPAIHPKHGQPVKPVQDTTQEDIKPDTALEKQIAEDHAEDDTNLLDPAAPKE